jgi:plasmid stabilization system protein ParE
VSEPVEETEEIDRRYVVRLRQRVLSDMGGGHKLMVKASSYRLADDWQDGFFEALRSLTRNPRQNPFCPELERTRGLEIRQLWYRRTPDATPWRAVFAVDAAENLVDVLHLRHGSRRPLTRKEKREIATEAREQP